MLARIPARLLLLASLVPLTSFLQACVHDVYRETVDARTWDQINTKLLNKCGGDTGCELVRCWQETAGLAVCDVDMSFAPVRRKTLLLSEVRDELATDGLNVGFCVHGTSGTAVAGVLAGALLIGVLNAATKTRGNGYGSYVVMNSGDSDTADIGIEEAPDSPWTCSTHPHQASTVPTPNAEADHEAGF